jgi:anti-anti-sigma factor
MASVSTLPEADDTSVQTLRIRSRRRGSTPVLMLHGEVDLATADSLAQAVRAALVSRPARLIVDMSAVDFFGIAGYHAVAEIAGEVEASECGFELRAPSPAVRRVFDILPLPVSSHPPMGPRIRAARMH